MARFEVAVPVAVVGSLTVATVMMMVCATVPWPAAPLNCATRRGTRRVSPVLALRSSFSTDATLIGVPLVPPFQKTALLEVAVFEPIVGTESVGTPATPVVIVPKVVPEGNSTVRYSEVAMVAVVVKVTVATTYCEANDPEVVYLIAGKQMVQVAVPYEFSRAEINVLVCTMSTEGSKPVVAYGVQER
jgi:hypothetical protein